MDGKHMTQAELAIAIGKGKSSVSQYISGKVIPREDVQKQIADVLDCTVEFLNGEEPKLVVDVTEYYPKGVCISECTNNVSVSEAAKLLGKSEQFVRIALQTGVAPFGFAVKNKSVFSYHISPKKLAEYIGA